MPEFPLNLLRDLASKEAQIRWIVEGDANEYLLPEELLNDAFRFCEIAAKIDAPSTARQREAIRVLQTTLQSLGDLLDSYDRSNISVLIEADPNWLLLRERAADVLRAFEPLAYE